jgi:hypothetical protein
MNPKRTQWVPNSEMSNFVLITCAVEALATSQGRTRVCGEAYFCTPQPETRRERRAGQKWPFMDGQ